MPPVENIWHSSHILKRRSAFCDKIDKYFKEGIYTDVNIICENRKFKCHRLALAAASEYFHRMFSGNFAESQAQDVVLHDFDSDTFEQILLFVYKGELAAIDDDNVFNLLRASDILQLSDLEDQCAHYLTQKNVPMDCALEIYLFASTLRKVAIIPAVSRFILQHLDRFSRESKFLTLSFEDFGSLLTYHQPSLLSPDTNLLNVIYRWVYHNSTDNREKRKSSFMELAKKVQFKSVLMVQIAEYFDRVDCNDESRRSEISKNSDTDLRMEMKGINLYMYVRTAALRKGSSRKRQTIGIFSLQRNVGKSIGWHYSKAIIRPNSTRMEIVESDDRLYYLSELNHGRNHSRCTFRSSTSFDLCTDVHSLAKPNCTFDRISLCCILKNIYCNGLPFQCYNTELGTWSPIPLLNEYSCRTSLVNDDTRLYMVYRNSSKSDSSFAAYDPRIGKVEQLNNDGLCLNTRFDQPWCYHKGRIYNITLDGGVGEKDARMAIYDIVAGRWELQELEAGYATPNSDRRLVSSNNRMWMLGLKGEGRGATMFTHIYDSYLQQWSGVYSEKVRVASTNSKLYSNLAGVLALKSS